MGSILSQCTPVLTAAQMREADRFTIESLGVSSEILMERAGAAVFEEIECRFPQARTFLILVGKGNNGGDGIVVGRLARERGKLVYLCPVGIELEGALTIEQAKALLPEVDVVVDALFGIGFRGTISEDLAELFAIPTSAFRIAVDLPSGVECDTGQSTWAFQADLTVTFQAYKPVHLQYPGKQLCGEVVLRDIGIDIQSWQSGVVTRQVVSDILLNQLALSATDYKGTRGHVTVFAGSRGHSGAAALAGRAALRAGAGLVTVVSDRETCQIAVSNTPELMSCELSDKDRLSDSLRRSSAVVIGPGMPNDESFLRDMLAQVADKRVVIDATALRLLARGNCSLPADSVLTPHPGELAELLGLKTAAVQADRLSAATSCARLFARPILLKGAFSILALPDGSSYFLPFAHPNLGTAGSGDVLAGLIGGLLARGRDFTGSVLAAAWLHGYSGSCDLPESYAGDLASDFTCRFSDSLQELLEDSR